MQILETSICDLLIIEPKIWEDERGYFFESYNAQEFAKNGLKYNWVQDNEAKSSKGVLRGLHFQKGSAAQAKLVRVSQGVVLDVAVDLRPDSATFGEHFSILLSDKNKKQLLVPRGFAHGYVALSEEVVFNYKCDNYYNKEMEGGIRFDDPKLAIDWVLEKKDFLISEKDLLLEGIESQDFTSYW